MALPGQEFVGCQMVLPVPVYLGSRTPVIFQASNVVLWHFILPGRILN